MFRGDCASAPIACDDDGGTGTMSRVVRTDAEPGAYYVIVEGWSGARGGYQLRVSLGASEVCDNGVDDDGNRLIDEFACACESSAPCSGVGSGGLFPRNTRRNTTFRVCAPRCDLLGGNLFCNNFFAGTRCNTMTGECVR